MFSRMRIVLTLIGICGSLSKIRIVKLMFLMCGDAEWRYPPYYFVPYKYGPFSFQLYADLLFLRERDYIIEKKNEIRAAGQKEGPTAIDRKHLATIREYVQKFENYSDSTLVKYVYGKYPEYTTYKALIHAAHRESGIVTIGYEGLSIDQFLMKMISSGVDIVVDVRKNARSRKYGFSSNLERFLKKVGIGYVHFPELGVSSEVRRNLDSFSDYQTLFCQYEKTLESESTLKIVRRILAMGLSQKVALMCFESNKEYCHRGVIGRKLREMGAQVIDL